MRGWRLPCPECDSGYRKQHVELDREKAAEELDVASGQLDEDATWVRCNNCRDVHTVEETCEYDVQGGIGI